MREPIVKREQYDEGFVALNILQTLRSWDCE
jgi:hypothetical protein